MKYKVSNMSCMHCVKRINTEFEAQGIKAEIELATKTITSDDERIVVVLTKLGYQIER